MRISDTCWEFGKVHELLELARITHGPKKEPSQHRIVTRKSVISKTLKTIPKPPLFTGIVLHESGSQQSRLIPIYVTYGIGTMALFADKKY